MSTETTAVSESALVAKTKIHLEPSNTASGAGAGYYAPGDRLPDDLLPNTVEEFVKYDSAQYGIPYVNDGPTITAEEASRIAQIFGLKMRVTVEKYEGDDSEARAADPNA